VKVLINKVTELGQQNGKDIDYKILITNCLNSAPISPSGQQIGFSRSEMKDRDAIEDALEESEDEDNNEIFFEDAVANNLKRVVNIMQWAMRHKDILEFIDAIDNMKKIKKKKKKKTNEIEEEAKKKETPEVEEDDDEDEEE